MKRVKAILKVSLSGLVLATVISLAGCGDGGPHRRHMSYGRDNYPSYSGSHHDGGGRSFARGDDRGWRRR